RQKKAFSFLLRAEMTAVLIRIIHRISMNAFPSVVLFSQRIMYRKVPGFKPRMERDSISKLRQYRSKRSMDRMFINPLAEQVSARQKRWQLQDSFGRKIRS